MAELDLLSKGLTTCQGCPLELMSRASLEVLGSKTITLTPPSCSAILTGSGDETGWGVPSLQTVLMSLPAFASGVSEALKIQGRNDVTVLGVAPLTSASRRCPVPSSAVTKRCSSATTMRLI